MDVSITDITDVEKTISIHASAQELIPHFERAYQRHLPKIEIKGFRKGKAPLDLVKKMHGEAIEYNAIDTIADELYRDVLRERDIHPIGNPLLTDIDYKPGDALTFTIKYEIKPNFTLAGYTDIAVERLVQHVTDPEVEEELLRLRKAHSTMVEAEKAEDDEHVVIADIQQLDESGSPLIGKKTADTRLYLASRTIYQEIKDALRGITAGATSRVRFEVKRDGTTTLNHLEIQVKKIEKVNIPELDAEFVAKASNNRLQDVEEFRRHLREDMENYRNEESERAVEDQLIGEIVRRHDFIVPESLLNGILDSLKEDLESRSPKKKLPPDFDEVKFREENRAYAIFQAKWYLIRERIIEAEGLRVDEADIDRIAEIESTRTGIEKERLVGYYRSSDATKDKILQQKLLVYLKSRALITEKVVEDHTEQHV